MATHPYFSDYIVKEKEEKEVTTLIPETSGNRSYDILHVAAAMVLSATEFWSFDARQRDLAKAAGLLVGP